MKFDPRSEKLVDLVLNYSLSLNKDDKLLVQFDPNFTNYANIFADKAKEIGSQVRYDSMSFDPVVLRGLLQRKNFHEWSIELNRRNELSKWCTARVLIDCDKNPNYANGLRNADSLVAEFNKRVVGPYKRVLYDEIKSSGQLVKWNIVGFPYKEQAKLIGMSLKDYSDFVYNATLIDWSKTSKEMNKVKAILDLSDKIRIQIGDDTDLSFSIKNRGGDICDGKLNMPDGEIFYGPIEDSMNGKIYFQHPSMVDGIGLVEGIRLEFKDGKIITAYASKNQNILEKRIAVDDGAKRIGEFGIGMNYGITRSTQSTLFDEKIGGTIHLAIGSSYETHALTNGGGLNKSAIHWDIVCDLRYDPKNPKDFPGGKIYADNKLVNQNGNWLV